MEYRPDTPNPVAAPETAPDAASGPAAEASLGSEPSLNGHDPAAPGFVGFAEAAARLAGRGYGFSANADEGLIHWIAAGRRANYDCYVDWADDGARAAAYAYLSERIPEELRHELAALVCRANWTLVWGNLDLDLDGGRLRVRKPVADPARGDAVEAACDAALADLERLHPLILGVVYGGLRPEDAFARLRTDGA